MIHRDAELLLAAGAALDDLAPDERAAWETHAAECGECRVLEAELAMVLADLALVVPERVPPANLLAGIRLAIDAEDERARREPPASSAAVAATVASGPAARETPVPVARPVPAGVTSLAEVRAARVPRQAVYAAVGLAAALALVAVGLGARTMGLQDDLDRSAAQVAALQARVADQGGVVAAAMDPGHVTVALHAEPLAPQASATVVFVPGSTSAWLVAANLPATPSGHGYQLWYADDAGVHPLQTVSYDGSGAFVVPLDVDLSASSAVMITLEESGGSQGDPGPQVVFGEI